MVVVQRGARADDRRQGPAKVVRHRAEERIPKPLEVRVTPRSLGLAPEPIGQHADDHRHGPGDAQRERALLAADRERVGRDEEVVEHHDAAHGREDAGAHPERADNKRTERNNRTRSATSSTPSPASETAVQMETTARAAAYP